MPDEKMETDTCKRFSQMDMDAATKPLHAEIERLWAMCPDSPVYSDGAAFRPVKGYPFVMFPPSPFPLNREVRDGGPTPRVDALLAWLKHLFTRLGAGDGNHEGKSE